jgi:hypothetical protein
MVSQMFILIVLQICDVAPWQDIQSLLVKPCQVASISLTSN